MTSSTKSDMAAFGASDAACYAYPDDTDVAKAQRAAFCAGAAWSAGEIERLRVALRMVIDNVETGSYESTGQAIDEAKKLLSDEQTARTKEV